MWNGYRPQSHSRKDFAKMDGSTALEEGHGRRRTLEVRQTTVDPSRLMQQAFISILLLGTAIWFATLVPGDLIFEGGNNATLVPGALTFECRKDEFDSFCGFKLLMGSLSTLLILSKLSKTAYNSVVLLAQLLQFQNSCYWKVDREGKATKHPRKGEWFLYQMRF